jgi:hypothetical protein
MMIIFLVKKKKKCKLNHKRIDLIYLQIVTIRNYVLSEQRHMKHGHNSNLFSIYVT